MAGKVCSIVHALKLLRESFSAFQCPCQLVQNVARWFCDQQLDELRYCVDRFVLSSAILGRQRWLQCTSSKPNRNRISARDGDAGLGSCCIAALERWLLERAGVEGLSPWGLRRR